MTRALRRRRLVRAATPLLCLLSSCALALAQSAQPASPSTAPQTPAQTVRLNVIVTDEAGRPVADVKREEIGVTEDGAAQAVAHFAPEELPVSYGLVLDNSRSVTPLLETIRRTAGTIAIANKAGDEAFVMRFVDSDKLEMLRDFTSDLTALDNALSSMYTEGGMTAVVDATYVAVKNVAERRKDDEGRRRAVVLISDCEDRESVYKREELMKLLRRESVQVFVISFLTEVSGERGFTRPSPREKARKLAAEIAEESGGRAFFPKDVNELVRAAEEVSRDLRSQYVVGYAPANASADGKFRKVEVKIADAPGRTKRLAVARPGYFAGK